MLQSYSIKYRLPSLWHYIINEDQDNSNGQSWDPKLGMVPDPTYCGYGLGIGAKYNCLRICSLKVCVCFLVRRIIRMNGIPFSYMKKLKLKKFLAIQSAFPGSKKTALCNLCQDLRLTSGLAKSSKSLLQHILVFT